MLHPDYSQLDTIITKVNGLNKKSGPFDSLILVGNTDNSLNSTDSSFDISTYFTNGTELSNKLESNSKKNLTYLGKHGIFTTTDDIKVGFVNGDEEYLSLESENILKLFNNSQLDILITFQWPKVIADENKLFLSNSNIDKFVEASKPKYHFACGSSAGKFFERNPFQWDDDRVTRFISIGKYGGTEKWIYAFNLNKDLIESIPKNLTENPYNIAIELKKNELKRKLDYDESKTQIKKSKRKIVAPENCFFCLSNPKLQSHMIISIGEHAYLTVAKGPLTKPTDLMKFSGHCLIIPIEHIANLEPNEENKSVIKTSLYNEILRYQSSLIKFFATFNLSTIFFQINKSDSVHFHIQVFPIAQDFLIDFEIFLNKNSELNNKRYKKCTEFKFEKFLDSNDENYLKAINSKKDYVQFQVFDQSIEKHTIYFSYVDPEKPLDLQFGRRVLAYLLQTPKRVKWDHCLQSEDKERIETETFKKNYASFDVSQNL